LTARGRRRGGATAEGLRSRARAPAMSRGAGVVVVSFIPIHYIIRLE
jgi:hypothetical protein